MEEPRLEVPDGPVLAGDELFVPAVVGASGRWIRIATNAQLTAVDDEDVGYWLWAAHGEQSAGWSRLTGPGPCSHSFSNGPVTFTLPPQITTGRYLLDVVWLREDLGPHTDPETWQGRARTTLEIVGPTAEDEGPAVTPTLHLEPALLKAGADFDCWFSGLIHGSRVGMPGWVALQRRHADHTDRWESVATLFAGGERQRPSWLPAGRGFFTTDLIDAGPGRFELPSPLSEGSYRVRANWTTLKTLGPDMPQCGYATAQIEIVPQA